MQKENKNVLFNKCVVPSSPSRTAGKPPTDFEFKSFNQFRGVHTSISVQIAYWGGKFVDAVWWCFATRIDFAVNQFLAMLPVKRYLCSFSSCRFEVCGNINNHTNHNNNENDRHDRTDQSRSVEIGTELARVHWPKHPKNRQMKMDLFLLFFSFVVAALLLLSKRHDFLRSITVLSCVHCI